MDLADVLRVMREENARIEQAKAGDAARKRLNRQVKTHLEAAKKIINLIITLQR